MRQERNVVKFGNNILQRRNRSTKKHMRRIVPDIKNRLPSLKKTASSLWLMAPRALNISQRAKSDPRRIALQVRRPPRNDFGKT